MNPFNACQLCTVQALAHTVLAFQYAYHRIRYRTLEKSIPIIPGAGYNSATLAMDCRNRELVRHSKFIAGWAPRGLCKRALRCAQGHHDS